MSLRNIHLKIEEVKDKSFEQVWTQLGLNTWEPTLVPDKEDANRYRIEKHGSCDDKGRVLMVHRAVSKDFKPFKNTTLLQLGKTIFDNEDFSIEQASVINFGEKIIIKAKLNGYEGFGDSTPGIGDLQPYINFLIPVAGTMNIALTTVQLFCSNQIPMLQSNPLNRFFSLNHRSDLEEKAASIQVKFSSLRQTFTDQIEGLKHLHNKPFSAAGVDGLMKYYAYLYRMDVETFEDKKLKLIDNLMDCYHNAPNADPGTMLGAFNSVTRYLVTKPYRESHTKYFKDLPTSPQYNFARRALKVANAAAQLEVPEDYFAHEFEGLL